jgi:hypothetical protein
MSDFLGNLVQRSLPAAAGPSPRPQLAPRLPSLFEAPAADVSRPEPSTSSPEPPTPATEPARWQPEETPSPTLIAPIASLAPPPVGWPATPADGEDAESMPLEVQTAVSDEPAQRSRLREAPALQPGPMTPRTSRVSAPEGALQKLSPVPLPPPSPALIRSRPDNSVLPLPGESSPIGAPTLRIHIGRIEVRAVQALPAPASHPRAVPKPKLSLDDYLKRRNEGKR